MSTTGTRPPLVPDPLRLIARSIAWALGVEVVWRLSRYKDHWPWETFWLHLGIGTLVVAALILGWRLWGRYRVRSRTRLTNFIGWTNLVPFIEGSWPITRAMPAAIIALYVPVIILELGNEDSLVGRAIQAFNTKVLHFNILGWKIDAIDVFKFELLGFVLGWSAYVVARLRMPLACISKEGPEDWRDPLTQSLRVDASMINEQQDIYDTLRQLIDDFSRIPEFLGFNWFEAQRRLDKLQTSIATNDVDVGERAALVVEALPEDRHFIRYRAQALFDKTEPSLRAILAVAVLASTGLVLLPVFLRALLVFFPILNGEP
jgi:hypothetical protein